MALNPGDIAFTGFNSDNPDEFTFVALVDIPAGEEIIFTDNGWFASGGFRANEGSFTYVAPSDIAAGTVIQPAVSGVAFSTSGDQIIAYQGDATNPSFLAAVHFDGTDYVNATSSNTTGLPTGLEAGVTALNLAETDNALYVGPTAGARDDLLAALNDPMNWALSNSRVTLSTDPFTVEGGDAASIFEVARQDFDEVGAASPTNPTQTVDSVANGGQLTNNGANNPSTGAPTQFGLGYQSFWFDTRGEGVGPVTSNDSSDFIGANSFSASNAPTVNPTGEAYAPGEQYNFQFNDTDGRVDLVFEAIDFTGFGGVTLDLNYWINNTGFESDDRFAVALSDSSTSVTALEILGDDLELAAAPDTTTWSLLSVDIDNLIETAGLDESEIVLTVSVDTNSSSENIFIDDVAVTATTVEFARQDFDEVGAASAVNPTQTFDSVADGGQLTNNGANNPSDGVATQFELGYRSFWFDTRGEGAGPVTSNDSSDFIGANSFSGSNAPTVNPDGVAYASGAQYNFEFNDTDGRVDLVFDPVDVSAAPERVVLLSYWINDTGYEADDRFAVSLSDGARSVTALEIVGDDLETAAALDATTWTPLEIDIDALFGGAFDDTAVSLTISVDTNSSSENIFVDNIVFEGRIGGSAPEPALVIVESDGATEVSEDGATDGFEVSLSTAPTDNVVITITTDGETTTAPTTLTFTPTNFATPQSVTVAAVDDAALEGAHSSTISLSAISNDGDYYGQFAQVTASVTDNDFVITPIYDIQGAGHVSSFVAGGLSDADFFTNALATSSGSFTISGDAVTTLGIVTAVDSNGFFIQDAVGDGEFATSDAIFVFTGGAPSGVDVGDEYRVEATVGEFFPGRVGTRNLPSTQLVNATLTELSSGNDLPDALVIGSNGVLPPTETIDDDAFAFFQPFQDGIDFFESVEGMLVTVIDFVATAPTNRFGEIFGVAGAENATGITDRGTLNVSPDDFNPEKIQIDLDEAILPGFTLPEVDAGAKLSDVTGVVTYDFGNFQVNPTEAFTVIEDSTLEAETTALAGDADTLTIATYNVLNLDPVVENLSDPRDVDDDVGNGRFDAIAAQIVNNLNAPDIIGLQEVQDNTGAEINDGVTSASNTLQRLVDAIAAAGGPEYAFIDNTFIGEGLSGGQPGGNIRTAFLYQVDRVDVVAGSVQTISGQAPGQTFNGARLPLVATFTFNGEDVTVVNNHFSSKGGSAPILGVEQDFAARQEDVTVNGSLDERQAQSAEVQTFVNTALAADPEANVVVLGDLNEFEFISAVEDLETNAGLTNLINDIDADERYSFIFQGNSQQLDHILVSDNLRGDAGIDIVHTNSEFAETAQRASDHDPVVAAFNFAAAPIIVSGGPGRDRLTGTDADEIFQSGGGFDLVTTGGGNDEIDLAGTFENGARDVVIVTDFDSDSDILGGIGSEDVARAFAFNGRAVLTLTDGDSVQLFGVSDPDDIVYENDLLIG